MPFIVIIIILIYIVLLAWTWHNLGDMEKTKKTLIIFIELIITYLTTILIFNISKAGIGYNNPEVENTMKTLLVSVFTGVNGLIWMPIVSKNMDQVNEGLIEKTVLKTRVIVIGIIFVICMVIEFNYIKDTQKSTIEMYNNVEERTVGE